MLTARLRQPCRLHYCLNVVRSSPPRVLESESESPPRVGVGVPILPTCRRRANMAQTRQSRLDPGGVFHAQVRQALYGVPSSLRSGHRKRVGPRTAVLSPSSLHQAAALFSGAGKPEALEGATVRRYGLPAATTPRGVLTLRTPCVCRTGVPRSQETSPPQDPTVGIFLEHYVGPEGWAFSYERGPPVYTARTATMDHDYVDHLQRHWRYCLPAATIPRKRAGQRSTWSQFVVSC